MKITDLMVPAVLLTVRVNILILFNLFSRHYLRSMAPGPAVYLYGSTRVSFTLLIKQLFRAADHSLSFAGKC